MAPPLIPTTTLLLLLLLLVLLPSSSAQFPNPGNFDISAQQGWDKFVEEASKGTGGTPIDMKEFISRVNGNINDGDEEVDPQLVEDLKNFEQGNGLPSGGKTENPAASGLDNVSTARMIASTNGGTLAPGNAPTSGALDVKVVGVVSVLLPAFAACFVASMFQ